MEHRTAEELRKPEYNFFIALNLAVTETNSKTIESAINRYCGNTSGDLVSRRLISLRQEIVEVMMNDATFDAASGQFAPKTGGRKAEAAAAKQFKLADVMQLVKNMTLSTGMLYKSELQDLCNNVNKNAKFFEFADLEKEFLAFIANSKVKYIDNTTNLIPFARFEKVSALLETPPASADLYEYFGVPATASVDELKNAKNAKYNEAQTRDLGFKQRASGLCGEAEEILIKDAATRKQYDYYVKVKTKVWDQFKMRRTYGARDLPSKEYYEFAQILMQELKLGIDDVEKMLGAGLKYYRLVVSGADAQSGLEICPYPDCGKVYESGAKTCPHCGRALEVICWNCGGKMPFTMKSKKCPVCAADYAMKDRLPEKIAAVEAVIAAPRFEITRVNTAINDFKNFVPGYAKANDSLIARQLKDFESRINARKQQIDRFETAYVEQKKQIDALVSAKNYLQAKSLAENLRTRFSSYEERKADTAKLISDIDAVIARAQRELATARQLVAQNEEQAIAAVLRALEIAADFNEARQFIAKYPPRAPLSVSVAVNGSVARLEWRLQPAHAGTTYSVIRKVGSVPANAEDGVVIATDLAFDFYEDKNVASATRYFYGVFAVRGGVRSPLVVCRTPVQTFGDVTGVRQEMIEDRISVKWEMPNNAKSVEVWKKKGSVAPQQAGDGVRINASANGFNDDEHGEAGYLILCKYEIDGVAYSSKGVSRTFKPYVILKKPDSVKIEQLSGNEFSLEVAMRSGNLRLLFAPEKLACRTETLAEAASYTEAVKGSRELKINYFGDKMSFTLPADTVGWVYPVVYNDQLFLVALPVLVNTIAGVKDLKYVDAGNSGMLTGKLHPAVVSVVAKVSERGFVSSVDEPADTLRLSASDFAAAGGFKLNLKRNVEYFVTVFAEAEVNGKRVMSLPVSLDGPICQRDKTVVKFALEYKPLPTKPFKVIVKFAADAETEIPELLLVRGSPRPMDKSKGEFVEKIPKSMLKKGLFGKEYTFKTAVTVPPMGAGMKFALFPADDNTGYVQLKEVHTL